MATNESIHDYIQRKIVAQKDIYQSMRSKPDDYVFSALAVKSCFYQNPAYVLVERDFDSIIVDGSNDGGVDFLLNDPSSEESDMIIGQSKYYETITTEKVMNALAKMASFYKEMTCGHYEAVNDRVSRRYLEVEAEATPESRIKFVFVTSAPVQRIQRSNLERKFLELFEQNDNIELHLVFGADFKEKIKESDERRPLVETGKLIIDEANNCLYYGENAAIVNISAFSLKELYIRHTTGLLAKNLRYHINVGDVDRKIRSTLQNTPEMFWMMNNGITIICDEFDVDGKEVKLTNFSIINGGQTSYVISKSKDILRDRDCFLPCKIIRSRGENEDEKNEYILSIAQAANNQKAIKPDDLRANAPEQVRFVQAMRERGIFYQSKRGEEVPKWAREPYLNTDLAEIRKLTLSGVFQMPCTGRSKPKTSSDDKFYDVVFRGNQEQIAKICQELLYIDYYFRKKFIQQYDSANRHSVNDEVKLPFAHNARTICIAFVALAGRYAQRNLSEDDLRVIFSASDPRRSTENDVYKIMKNLSGVDGLFPRIFEDKDKYEAMLNTLFRVIIEEAYSSYSIAQRYDSSLNATNFLKKDYNYYCILQDRWAVLREKINAICM